MTPLVTLGRLITQTHAARPANSIGNPTTSVVQLDAARAAGEAAFNRAGFNATGRYKQRNF